jgi:hypothetical protein
MGQALSPFCAVPVSLISGYVVICKIFYNLFHVHVNILLALYVFKSYFSFASG